MRGRLLACVSLALATPVHKKGAVADAANHRPIAVGELLYRLYTIILNARPGQRSMASGAQCKLASMRGLTPMACRRAHRRPCQTVS